MVAGSIEALLSALFGTVLGSPIAMGLVALLILVAFGVAFHLNFEGFLIMLLPALFLLSIYGLLPEYLLVGLVLVCGFIIFMALMLLTRKR